MGGDTPQWLFYMHTVSLKLRNIYRPIDFCSADICIILKQQLFANITPFGLFKNILANFRMFLASYQ